MEAVKHIEFMVHLYRKQLRGGRLFLHEHPAQASSWDLNIIKQLAKEEGVTIASADQCMYGLRTPGPGGTGSMPARKPTKFMTNGFWLGQELSVKCDMRHAHQPLLSGRAEGAARYPPRLVQAICRGLLTEMKYRDQGVKSVAVIQKLSRIAIAQRKEVEHEEEEKTRKEELSRAWDDVSGAELNPEGVRSARKKEMDYINNKKVWTKISRTEAEKKGWHVIQTKWIDVNKGDADEPLYRSRPRSSGTALTLMDCSQERPP